MTWDGAERRQYCKQYCEAHIDMVTNMTRIDAKLDSIEAKINEHFNVMKEHVEQGNKWRLAILGVIFAGIIQIVSFAYLFGTLNNQVNINTERWNRFIEKTGFK